MENLLNFDYDSDDAIDELIDQNVFDDHLEPMRLPIDEVNESSISENDDVKCGIFFLG